jgi:hypothetical protein
MNPRKALALRGFFMGFVLSAKACRPEIGQQRLVALPQHLGRQSLGHHGSQGDARVHHGKAEAGHRLPHHRQTIEGYGTVADHGRLQCDFRVTKQMAQALQGGFNGRSRV